MSHQKPIKLFYATMSKSAVREVDCGCVGSHTGAALCAQHRTQLHSSSRRSYTSLGGNLNTGPAHQGLWIQKKGKNGPLEQRSENLQDYQFKGFSASRG